MSVTTIIWLLPVFFMLHDFEELILFRIWFQKNGEKILPKVPRPLRRVISKLADTQEGEFALAVAEEFIILAALSFICAEFRCYNLFASVVAAFLLHLLIHLIQSIVIGRYVPGIINGAIAAAYSIYALFIFHSRDLIQISTAAKIFPIIIIAVAANLFFAHWSGRRLYQLLKNIV